MTNVVIRIQTRPLVHQTKLKVPESWLLSKTLIQSLVMEIFFSSVFTFHKPSVEYVSIFLIIANYHSRSYTNRKTFFQRNVFEFHITNVRCDHKFLVNAFQASLTCNPSERALCLPMKCDPNDIY